MAQGCIRGVEFAKRMHMSVSAAYVLLNDPNFYPAFRIGRSIFISEAALEKWLEEQTRSQSTSKAV